MLTPISNRLEVLIPPQAASVTGTLNYIFRHNVSVQNFFISYASTLFMYDKG